MPQGNYYAYIVANPARTINIGVTNDLEQRVWQHRHHALGGFTARYGIARLVWFELFPHIDDALACEKRLKGWTRRRKIALIEERNPDWLDLSRDWPI